LKTIQIFIGSPRKKGNTNILSDILISKIDTDRFHIEKVYLSDHKISPCVDCRGCKKNDLICIVKDDMNSLYEQIDHADVLIFGSPIYWFGPSGIMKNFLDRFRPYYGNKKLLNKEAALLLPAGTGAEDCDLTIELFKRSFEALGINFLGAMTAKAYDVGEVNKDTNALSNIDQLASLINTL